MAELLDTSVASVNSALQRARAGLEARRAAPDRRLRPRRRRPAAAAGALRGGVRGLRHGRAGGAAARGRDPLDAALRHVAVRAATRCCTWFVGTGIGCRGSRMLPTVANGMPAFGQYRVAEDGAGHEAWALQVLELSDGRITGINAFLDVRGAVPAVRAADAARLSEAAAAPRPVRSAPAAPPSRRRSVAAASVPPQRADGQLHAARARPALPGRAASARPRRRSTPAAACVGQPALAADGTARARRHGRPARRGRRRSLPAVGEVSVGSSALSCQQSRPRTARKLIGSTAAAGPAAGEPGSRIRAS